MEYKDYYKILGVVKEAGADEIKKAYRKLAVFYHPDKNPGDHVAEENFKEINEAYDVLGNANKRTKYDSIGENWEDYQKEEFDDKKPDSKTYSGEGLSENSDFFMEEKQRFSAFFEHIFGKLDSFSDFSVNENMQIKGEDYKRDIYISLEEAILGSVQKISLEDEIVSIKIKAGIQTGQILKIREKGGPGLFGGAPGDVLLNVIVNKHDKFNRQGDDLYCDEPLNVFTAITGGKIQVKLIDKTVVMNVPSMTENYKLFRLKGMGIPNYKNADTKGDIIVRVVIYVPKQISERDIEIIRSLDCAKSPE